MVYETFTNKGGDTEFKIVSIIRRRQHSDAPCNFFVLKRDQGKSMWEMDTVITPRGFDDVTWSEYTTLCGSETIQTQFGEEILEHVLTVHGKESNVNAKWIWLRVRIWAMQLVVLIAVVTGSRTVKFWAMRKLMKFIPELLSHIPEPHMEA